MERTTQRQVAIKATIQELLASQPESDEQGTVSLVSPEKKKYSRVQVMGILVHKETQGTVKNFLIDDGTGTFLLRSFESPLGTDFTVGKTLLAIGKVRFFNQEKYLSPEIVKEVSPAWMKVHLRKLRGEEKKEEKEDHVVVHSPSLEIPLQVSEAPKQEEEKELPAQKMTLLIQRLDTGNGAVIEEVLGQAVLPHTEELLQKMLERGEIFEISPGRVKVL